MAEAVRDRRFTVLRIKWAPLAPGCEGLRLGDGWYVQGLGWGAGSGAYGPFMGPFRLEEEAMVYGLRMKWQEEGV
jgi:hypothetical protein